MTWVRDMSSVGNQAKNDSVPMVLIDRKRLKCGTDPNGP